MLGPGAPLGLDSELKSALLPLRSRHAVLSPVHTVLSPFHEVALRLMENVFMYVFVHPAHGSFAQDEPAPRRPETPKPAVKPTKTNPKATLNPPEPTLNQA